MEYRHELKFEVSAPELKKIEYRLKPFVKKDIHQQKDYYLIRSVYFDDFRGTCLDENEAGTDPRAKFRIRIYDGSSDLIRLEKKIKRQGMTRKESELMSYENCLTYLEGRVPGIGGGAGPVFKELFSLALSKGMMPKCIVEYERSAYVYPAGNVRITFDRNIRGSADVSALFDERIDAVPVNAQGRHILEVKYDELLPGFLLAALDTGSLMRQAFSKYYMARQAIAL